MVFAMGSANSGWAVRAAPFTFTVSERAALLNWACFDALPLALHEDLLWSPRYVNSPEFQPDDQDALYRRMVKILEDITPGAPVPWPAEDHLYVLRHLDESWFSDKIAEIVARWGTGQMYCYQRARYLFVSHWLNLPQDSLHKVVLQATDIGLNTRAPLAGLNFDGSRNDVHFSE